MGHLTTLILTIGGALGLGMLWPVQQVEPLTRGESNVLRAMPHARQQWKGGATDRNMGRFEWHVKHFECVGFQSEAEMEAARRILSVPQKTVDSILKKRCADTCTGR